MNRDVNCLLSIYMHDEYLMLQSLMMVLTFKVTSDLVEYITTIL